MYDIQLPFLGEMKTAGLSSGMELDGATEVTLIKCCTWEKPMYYYLILMPVYN